MAGRYFFTGEEVVGLLDLEGEDGGMEDTFFPGSDEELWVSEDEESDKENELERFSLHTEWFSQTYTENLPCSDNNGCEFPDTTCTQPVSRYMRQSMQIQQSSEVL